MKLIQWLFIIERLVIISGYPVHGGWTVWGHPEQDGPCSITCGRKMGKVTVAYFRTCTNPKPKNGGKKCVGHSKKNHFHNCMTVKRCPVDGGWGEWMAQETGACSVTCGTGVAVTKRLRPCDHPSPGYGGKKCDGKNMETSNEPCETGLACDSSGPTQKAVNGGWNEWVKATSGRCSVTCGTGTQVVYHQRQCDKPSPKAGGLFCAGAQVHSKMSSCKAEVLCNPNGGWSAWGPPKNGECPVTCGQGVQINVRKRECNNPKPKPGHKCIGDSTLTEHETCEPGTRCLAEDGSATLTPSQQVSGSNTTLYVGIVIPVLIIIALAVGGVYYFRKKNGNIPIFLIRKRTSSHGPDGAKSTMSSSPSMGNPSSMTQGAKSTMSSSPTKQSMANPSSMTQGAKSTISSSPTKQSMAKQSTIASPKSTMSHSPTKQSMASPKSTMSHSPTKQSMASPKSTISHSPKPGSSPSKAH